jgi:hypothetical protein
MIRISDKEWDRIWWYQINGCLWKGYKDYLRKTRKMLENKMVKKSE